MSNKSDLNINENSKKEIALPVIAAILSSSSILLFLISLSFGVLPSFVVLLMVLLPIIGFIMGIVALCRGKKRIGIIGMILAIIAILIPASVVSLIIILFIGVVTNLIPLM